MVDERTVESVKARIAARKNTILHEQLGLVDSYLGNMMKTSGRILLSDNLDDDQVSMILNHIKKLGWVIVECIPNYQTTSDLPSRLMIKISMPAD